MMKKKKTNKGITIIDHTTQWWRWWKPYWFQFFSTIKNNI